MSTELAIIENLRSGRVALERAVANGDIRELKMIADVGSAMKRLAEAQGEVDGAKRFAATLELDAKRGIGELLKKQPKQTGGDAARKARYARGTEVAEVEVVPPPSLTELGLTKRQSSDAQRIASIPEEEFEAFKAEARTEDLNTKQAVQLAREIQREGVTPILDASERELRLKRVRALRLIAEAEGAGAFLHGQLADIVDAAQHDDADRHERDLRESARLLILVADAVGVRELRRVK